MLEIRFRNGDFVSLEVFFSNAADVEKIVLADQDGIAMAVYKNFSVFMSIRKDKGMVLNETTEDKADVVTVTLEKEPEWKSEARKLAELQAMNTAGILDLAETVSGMVEGGAQ